MMKVVFPHRGGGGGGGGGAWGSSDIPRRHPEKIAYRAWPKRP